MKFLLLVKNKENAPALDDPFMATKAARDYLHQGMTDGLIECVYQFSSGNRAMAIAEADTAEELWETLTTYPLYEVQDYEVHPLTDVDFVFEKYLKRLETRMKV